MNARELYDLALGGEKKMKEFKKALGGHYQLPEEERGVVDVVSSRSLINELAFSDEFLPHIKIILGKYKNESREAENLSFTYAIHQSAYKVALFMASQPDFELTKRKISHHTVNTIPNEYIKVVDVAEILINRIQQWKSIPEGVNKILKLISRHERFQEMVIEFILKYGSCDHVISKYIMNKKTIHVWINYNVLSGENILHVLVRWRFFYSATVIVRHNPQMIFHQNYRNETPLLAFDNMKNLDSHLPQIKAFFHVLCKKGVFSDINAHVIKVSIIISKSYLLPALVMHCCMSKIFIMVASHTPLKILESINPNGNCIVQEACNTNNVEALQYLCSIPEIKTDFTMYPQNNSETALDHIYSELCWSETSVRENPDNVAYEMIKLLINVPRITTDLKSACDRDIRRKRNKHKFVIDPHFEYARSMGARIYAFSLLIESGYIEVSPLNLELRKFFETIQKLPHEVRMTVCNFKMGFPRSFIDKHMRTLEIKRVLHSFIVSEKQK